MSTKQLRPTWHDSTKSKRRSRDCSVVRYLGFVSRVLRAVLCRGCALVHCCVRDVCGGCTPHPVRKHLPFHFNLPNFTVDKQITKQHPVKLVEHRTRLLIASNKVAYASMFSPKQAIIKATPFYSALPTLLCI